MEKTRFHRHFESETVDFVVIHFLQRINVQTEKTQIAIFNGKVKVLNSPVEEFLLTFHNF